MTVTPILIIVLAIFFIILVILNHFNVFSLWLQGKFSNANTNVRFFHLIGMLLRRVPLEAIVDAHIRSCKAHIRSCKAHIPIDMEKLEAHYLAGGNVQNVVQALIYVKHSHIKLDFNMAAAIDLSGGNVLEVVKGYEKKELREKYGLTDL